MLKSINKIYKGAVSFRSTHIEIFDWTTEETIIFTDKVMRIVADYDY